MKKSILVTSLLTLLTLSFELNDANASPAQSANRNSAKSALSTNSSKTSMPNFNASAFNRECDRLWEQVRHLLSFEGMENFWNRLGSEGWYEDAGSKFYSAFQDSWRDLVEMFDGEGNQVTNYGGRSGGPSRFANSTSGVSDSASKEWAKAQHQIEDFVADPQLTELARRLGKGGQKIF